MPLLTTTCQAERRARVRFHCTLDTFCFPLQTAGEACCEGQVQDISQKGIGLVLNQPFEPGAILGIEMGYKVRRRSRILVARVIHITAQADGRWLVGCEFAFQLTDRDIKALF
jgi:hypothetical protein